MKNIITPFDWRAELENIEVDSIDDDFILIDNQVPTSNLDHPFKMNVTVAIICTKGTMEGYINLKKYTVNAPCLFIILADQILQYKHISEDFHGYFIIMSNRFMNSLFGDIDRKFPLFRSVQNSPSIPLGPGGLNAMVSYFSMLRRAIRVKEHPHRLAIAKHLTLALFYGLGSQYHIIPSKEKRTKQELLVEEFLSYAKANFKQQRSVDFYADKLCLTPKYLSKVIKETSGKSASDWINDYVILEAKALLISTNMTIQQISNELNFPSQSFFGKYFKRSVGASPKEYRKE